METSAGSPPGITATRWFRTAAAIFFVALWGSAFVPSKIGVLASSPLWFLVVRFFVSGIVALGIALALGAKWPRGRRAWILIVALGVLANAMYLGFTYEALRHLAAGVGSVVTSSNPLLLAIVAPAFLGERLTPWKLLGLLLGFAGVVAIMIGRSGTGTAEPRDVLLCLIAVIGSVASTVVFKKFGSPHATWGVPIVAAFVYLVVVMSVGGSLLWFWLLEQGEASRVTAYYFLSPVFGLLIASFFGEALSIHDLGGLVAIAVGIAIVQRS